MWHIGPHIINNAISPKLLQKWNPSSITLIDGDINYIREIRTLLPNIHINLRIYFPDNEISDKIKDNPLNAAHYYHTETLKKYSSILNIISTIQIENEILQSGDDLKKLNQYALAHMQYANNCGYKICNFAFSVGNPDIPNWSLLTDSLKYAEDTNHIVGVHQYGKPPTFWTVDPDWHIHRLEHKVLPILPFKKLKFLVCEYGLDNLLYGNGTPGGYKYFISNQDYYNQLIDISKYLEQFTNRIIGYNIFTLGNNNPWQSYDINGELTEKLADYGRNYLNNSIPDNNNNNNKPNTIFIPIVIKDKLDNIDKTENKITYSKATPYLRLREQPNTDSKILDEIYPYEPIGLIENGEWAKVEFNSQIGYIKSTWLANEKEQWLFNYALQNNIDYLLLLALLNIESQNDGFRNDGELTLRFEAHIFKQFFAIDMYSKELFIKHFNVYKNLHYVYINGQPIEYHQADMELEALNIAKKLNEDFALQSTSWGIPQIMGFNYKVVGFNNVFDLLTYMQQSELNQIKIFIAFIENRGIIPLLQQFNYEKIAELYNGSGNIATYSKLLKDEYKYLKYGN